ncbi:MAG TPA: response regulator [Pyrinomonadaceae bacterium]|nr:response regulator [Pyrinomonadaceae bacterium]
MVTGRKLLLADDSVTIQKVIDLTFSDEGIEVTTVSNGEQAILKLEEIQPDIVLADIFMPGRSGYEVCEHIKRDERFRHIPVMLLVGSFEPFDEAEARRVGADDYLTKPFQSIRQLVSKVTALISGGGANSEDKVSTRDLELPEEAARNEKARADGSADIYTADTAPLPKELADKDPMVAAAHLAGHESLDDEMIEARTANEITEPRETIGTNETRPTAPLSFADLAEAGIKPPAQNQPEPLQETIRDLKVEEMNEDVLSTEQQSRTQSRYMSNAAAADEALLDLGDIDPPVSMTEADDFILDLQDEAPAASMPEPAPASSAWSEAAQPAVEAAGVAAGSEFAQPVANSSAYGFSQEMPPAMSEPAEASATYGAEEVSAHDAYIAEEPGVVESTAAEAFVPQVVSHGFSETTDVAMQERALPEEATATGVDAEAASAEAPAEGAPHTGQITLDQLSPEAIDAIARRAVELLSTKVVEEIAWEVVPQLAELLIKRHLEREKAQRP